MADTIKSGDICTVARDIVIGGETAFKEGELVLVEDIAPNQQRPESKYVVRSRSLDKRFQLSDADIYTSHRYEPTPEPRERTGLRERFGLRWPVIGLGILATLVAAVIGAAMFMGDGGQKKPSNTVWAVGEEGTILKTVDGGMSWSHQDSDTKETLYSIAAANEETAWAGGEFGKVLKTTNGGLFWTPQSTGAPTGMGNEINQIIAIDEKVAWARAGRCKVLRTIDGGSTWSCSDLFVKIMASPISVYADNPKEAWSVAFNGLLLRTKDGGEHWLHSETDLGSSNLKGFSAASNRTAWVTMRNGDTWKTTNGGRDFVKQESSTANTMRSLCAVDERMVWATGGNDTVLKTTDGGDNWTSLTTGTGYGLRDIWAVDENTAWVLCQKERGYSGYDTPLLKTSDGGNTWQPQDLGTNATIHDIGLVK